MRDCAVFLDGIASEYDDAPAVEPQESAGDADGGRLAGAVRADHAEHLSLRHVEGHAVERGDRAVSLRGVLELNRAHCCTGSSASTGMPGLSTPSLVSAVTLMR